MKYVIKAEIRGVTGFFKRVAPREKISREIFFWEAFP